MKICTMDAKLYLCFVVFYLMNASFLCEMAKAVVI